MALSGSVTTSAYTSGNVSRSVTLNWTATQSVSTNKSTVSWSLVGAGSQSGYMVVSEIRITINGSEVYYRNSSKHTDCYYGTEICHGSTVILHNADGTKNLNIKVEAGIYNWTINKSGEKSFTLTPIPRASTLSCSQFTLGSAGTITINRAVSTFTHTVKYAWGSLSGTLATKTSNTSLSWTPNLETMANEIPNNASGTGTLTCETFDGNTLIGTTSMTFTALVPDSVKPSVTSFTALRVDNTVPSAWGFYVQNKSQCQLTAVGAGMYNSTIKGFSIKQGNTLLSSASVVVTPILTDSGSITFTCTATDSRGRVSDPVTVTISVVEYSTPTVTSVLSQRCLQNGTLNEDGTYIKSNGQFTFASCSNKNAVTSKVYYREVGTENWSTGVRFTSGTAVVIAGSASADKAWEVKYELQDAFTTVSFIDIVSTSYSTIDFRLGGKGVAVGKVSEKDAFECAMDAEFTGSVKIGNNTLSDFVVEEGASGIWTYRKWNSGLAECWGRYAINGVKCNSGVGNWFKTGNIQLPDYPFTFVSDPTVNLFYETHTGTGGMVWSAEMEDPTSPITKIKPGMIYIIRMTSSTSISGWVNAYATGRWKS